MTRKDYIDKMELYKKSNPEYAGLLSYVLQFCQDDFLPLFEQAEKQGKKLVLCSREELLQQEFPDMQMEPFVELADISIQ